MVLDNATAERIKSLVYQRPRSMNELAHALGKNWRTVDRYVEQIMLRSGQIKTMVFRGGTRGALKIVYWNNTDKIYSSDVQERLFKQIELGVEKSDFSPFEIFQYVDAEKRSGEYELIDDEVNYDYRVSSLLPFFASVQKELCIFAGNLGFIHLEHEGVSVLDHLRSCVERGVVVKVLTDMHLFDIDNMIALLGLNAGLKHPLVEIRHAITPLRAYIFDDVVVRLGEMKKSPGKQGQAKSVIAMYYEVRERSWVEWLQKLFWKKFQEAIPGKRRLENLKSISRLS